MTTDPAGAVEIIVNGAVVAVDDPSATLLDVLRGQGLHSVKDGCSPQGQCGCCTVLVDGKPRVSCVTPVRRVRSREITTVEGLPEEVAVAWGDAFAAAGASQCGFCTPGIICRFAGLQGAHDASGATERPDRRAAAEALLAHLCRCTGWQTVLDAWESFADATGTPADPAGTPADAASPVADPAGSVRDAAGSVGDAAAPVGDAAGPVGDGKGRATTPDGRAAASPVAGLRAPDPEASQRRAAIEGGTAQQTGPHVALGGGGFADDTAPPHALVAVLAADDWVVAETRAEALRLAGKVQGRRTTAAFEPPIELPDGDWQASLRTSWTEPGYLETDASWCEPGGEPAGPLANGGAFGAKTASPVAAAARRLADEHGRAVRVLYTREDSVRHGPKRPPMAAGLRADGSGVVRVARTPGIAEIVRAAAPGAEVQEVDVAGPPTSAAIRCAGRLEMEALAAALRGAVGWITFPGAGSATAALADDGSIDVRVRCGDPLDETVLRSYCIGAAHMGLSLVTAESLAVDPAGEVHDLTIRSFGILRAVDTPPIRVSIEPDDGPPVNGSDAVFAAVAAAVWLAGGCAPVWPTGRGSDDLPRG